ncbi:DNA repair protein RecN [soil metagenome]
MWQHLRLRSLGVIDEAELELGPGFTVITGETGAGKTMVVTALGLLRGERSDLGLIRRDATQARVEALVTLDGNQRLIDLVEEHSGEIEDGAVILGRVLSAQGRSRAYMGGASVPASVLSAMSDELVAVHGQSDQHRLLQPVAQLQSLDTYAGEALNHLLSVYRPAQKRLQEVIARLQDLRTQSQERARELDLLTFGLDEIAVVDPQIDEHAHIVAEEGRLAHAESLARAAGIAHDLIAGAAEMSAGDEGAYAAASQAIRSLQDVAGHDQGLDDLATRLQDTVVALGDVASDLGSYSQSVELDPARLAAVQQRRAELASLIRKYGPTLDDLHAWVSDSTTRVDELSRDDSTIADLEHEHQELVVSLVDQAIAISEVRKAAAQRLAAEVMVEIHQLSMPHAAIDIAVTRPEDLAEKHLGPHGVDSVEFLFAANNGAPLRSLSKGASGGELSRVMLGLEVVLVDKTSATTLVFDEVDAGIGGKAAVEVGRRLARLARHAQVLAVTHLPQVAAFADHHFHVDKSDDGAVTSSSIRRLDEPGRVDELSRMLAGQEDSASAQAHARELLELARH